MNRTYWSCLLALGLLAPSDAPAQAPVPPWPATDALGRSLPLPGEAPSPRPNRFVGMFYFLWHDNRGGARPEGDGPFDVSKILARDPDALKHPDSPLWGPIGRYHYWAEPLHGYYLSDDPWVIRRHARLLSEAGVDTLVFDATNAQSYPAVYTRLCEVFAEVRAAGGRTPQVAFMVNTQAGPTARRIHRDLYRPGRFRDLWFLWEGKPLMLCDPAEAPPEVRESFTLRKAHWPFTLVNTPYAWHWEATYPQPFGYTDDPKRPEQVDVSVAQNLRIEDGKVTNMSAGDARGRSFHDGARDPSPAAIDRGANFEEQWKRAFELDPPFVLVTGWNEWIAGRWGKPGGPVEFVDQFDREHSRDIEPMKGGHGDAYYYQLVANVRRHKGVGAFPRASGPKSIDISGGFDQWDGVEPEFLDDAGDTAPRDSDGAGGTHYVDRSGRNDLVACKVARDPKNLAFLVRARGPFDGRPTLLIDADRDPRTGWEGFDFAVDREPAPGGPAWLERNLGGWKWEKVAPVPFRAEGARIHLAIPRAALGLPDDRGLDFQWVDHPRRPGDVMDFYASGDVAPEGRFRFRYSAD